MAVSRLTRCIFAGAALLSAALWLPSSATVESQEPKAVRKEIGKNVYLEIEGDKRRVLVNATVCLRKGQLEQLLTKKSTKEHEAILAADVDARSIHLALTLAGVEPGSPVKFRPKFTPPTGGAVKITMEYQDKGKTVRVPAQSWIRNVKTRKDLDTDWVFAGSALFQDPMNKNAKPHYLANDGDVICIANFDSAMLDVPFSSAKDNDDLVFEAHTERIPPLETPVVVILEPVLAKKR